MQPNQLHFSPQLISTSLLSSYDRVIRRTSYKSRASQLNNKRTSHPKTQQHQAAVHPPEPINQCSYSYTREVSTMCNSKSSPNVSPKTESDSSPTIEIGSITEMNDHSIHLPTVFGCVTIAATILVIGLICIFARRYKRILPVYKTYFKYGTRDIHWENCAPCRLRAKLDYDGNHL